MRFIIYDDNHNEQALAKNVFDAIFTGIFDKKYSCEHHEIFRLSKTIEDIEISINARTMTLGMNAHMCEPLYELIKRKEWIGNLAPKFMFRCINGFPCEISDTSVLSVPEMKKPAVGSNRIEYSLRNKTQTIASIYHTLPSHALSTVLAIKSNASGERYYRSDGFSGKVLYNGLVVLHSSHLDLSIYGGEVSQLGPGIRYFREENVEVIKRIVIISAKVKCIEPVLQYFGTIGYSGLKLFPHIFPVKPINSFPEKKAIDKEIFEVPYENVVVTKACERSINPAIQGPYSRWEAGPKNLQFCFVCGAPVFDQTFVFGRLLQKRGTDGYKLFGFLACQHCALGENFPCHDFYNTVYLTRVPTSGATVHKFFNDNEMISAETSKMVMDIEARFANGEPYEKTDKHGLNCILGNSFIANDACSICDLLDRPNIYNEYIIT